MPVDVSNAVKCFPREMRDQLFPPGMELQRIVDVADSGCAKAFKLTWNSLRDAVLLVLLRAAGGLGKAVDWPWSALWRSRLP